MIGDEAHNILIDLYYQDYYSQVAFLESTRKKMGYDTNSFTQSLNSGLIHLKALFQAYHDEPSKKLKKHLIRVQPALKRLESGPLLHPGTIGLIEIAFINYVDTISKKNSDNLDIPNATLDQIIKPEFISRVYDKLEEKKLFNRAAQVWIDKRKGYQCNASRIFLGIPPKYLIEGIELTPKLVKSVLQNTFNISMTLRTTQSALNGINTDFFLH
jgi:hypothetical protein